MTHPSKRYLTFIPIFTSQLFFFTYGAFLIYFAWKGKLGEFFHAGTAFMQASEYAPEARMVVIILLLEAALSAALILSLFIFFRKTHSPEVFFFLFGLLGLTLQSARFLMVPLSLVSLSSYSLIPITRLVYFGRLLTVLSFFASGLFATGFTSPRRNFYLSIMLLVSFIIAATLPVDFTSVESPLLFAIGEETGFNLAYYSLAVFTVLNFILAAYQHSESIYWYAAGAILMVFLGVELLFLFPYGLYAFGGLALVTAGTLLFANRTHEIYLWI